jgi:putative ABC transport system permease protein
MVPPPTSRSAQLVAGIGGWLYRVLLLAYPPGFRAEHGDEAVQVFADACRDSWTERGLWALLGRLVRAILEVPRHGVAERFASREASVPRSRRRGRLLAELSSDVRYAVRSIRRRPALAAGVIVTLALGIGSNTAMFSVVHATLLRPLPYSDPDRVVYIRTRDVETNRLSDPTAEDLQRWAPLLTSIERVEARAWRSVLLTGAEGATRVRMLEVSAGYLATVGSRPVAGRGLDRDDGRPDAAPVVVLSEGLWRSRYAARTDVIGRTIDIDSTPRTVVGVVTDVMSDVPGLRFSLFTPLPSTGAAAREATALGVAWLEPGTTIEAARAELESVSASVNQQGRRVSGTLEAPANVFWDARALREPQLALMAGVFLLLLIACVNVATLLLGAGQQRAQELAVRLALGATRFRLARLLLVESLVLALAGSAIGLLIASSAVQLFAAMDPGPQLQTRLEAIRLDGPVVAYALAIALLTAAASGIVPALRGSAAAPRTSLFEAGRTANRPWRLSQVFIGVEIALSLVLLIAGGLVGRAFLQMRLAEPGFAADRVLGVRIALPDDRYQTPERRAAFFDDLVARAARLPGVAAVGLGYGAMPPSDFVALGAFETNDGREYAADVEIGLSFVGPGHFALTGIPLLAGGGFSSQHVGNAGTTERPVVVSDSLRRRFWPDRSPVGEGFQMTDARGTRRYRIVGVAGDASGRGLVSRTGPQYLWQMYLPLPASRQYTEVLLRLADGAPPPVAALRAAIAQVDPDVPSDDGLKTAAASLHGFLRQQRFRAALFGGFAALSVALVAFGLLAVVFHAVKQRKREIGIRLALGGRPSQVRRQILAQGLRPAAFGLAAGMVLAALLTRALASFLHGINTTDGVVFLGSAVLLMGVAVVAMLGPILHATRVNPADVLRGE